MATQSTTTSFRLLPEQSAIRSRLQTGVLVIGYLGTMVLMSAVSTLSVVYLTSLTSLPVAFDLLIVVLGIAGICISPTGARLAVTVLDVAMNGDWSMRAKSEEANHIQRETVRSDGKHKSALTHIDRNQSIKPRD